MGRRVQNVVETYDGSSWSTNAVTKFVWDLSAVPTGQAGGWLLIAELDGTDSDALTRTYTWGLDLSGTFRGAGGIRLRSGSYGGHVVGLLMVDDDTGDGLCGYYAYDGNGNVGQVLDAEDLSTDAHYEYDPYGREIVATGTYADDNPWRFSTKYLDILDPNDIDASLLYYGFRSYAPRLGRWMSRDPIAEVGAGQVWGAHGSGSEAGGIKDAAARRSQPGSLVAGAGDLRRAYSFVANAPIGTIDYLGLRGIPGGDVPPCTIVIFFGHKSKNDWKKVRYVDPHCSASTLVACNTAPLLVGGGGFPNPVPGYGGTGNFLWFRVSAPKLGSGGGIEPHEDARGKAWCGANDLPWWQDHMEKAIDASEAHIRNVLCPRCRCTCGGVFMVEFRHTSGSKLATIRDYRRGRSCNYRVPCP